MKNVKLIGRLRLLTAALVLIITPGLTAATYYLGGTGNDSTGNGSASYPWKTFSKAASAMVAGDTLLLYGGDYYPTSEQYFYNNKATSSSRITISSKSGEWATIHGSSITNQQNNFGILTIGGNYITIKNMAFKNGKQIGLRFWSSSYCIVDGITSEYNNTSGIAMDGDYSATNAADGRSKNRNNKIQNCYVGYNCQVNAALAASSWPASIALYNGSNNTIYNTYSYRNYGEGIISAMSTNTLIDSCTSTNNHSVNIYFDNCQNSEVKNSTVNGSVTNGLIWNGICNSAENYNSIFELNPNGNYFRNNQIKYATWGLIWVGQSGGGDPGIYWAERTANTGWYTGNTFTGCTNNTTVVSGNTNIVNGAKP